MPVRAVGFDLIRPVWDCNRHTSAKSGLRCMFRVFHFHVSSFYGLRLRLRGLLEYFQVTWSPCPAGNGKGKGKDCKQGKGKAPCFPCDLLGHALPLSAFDF